MAATAAVVSSQGEQAVERSNELFAEFGRDPSTTGLVGQYLLDNGYLEAFENSDAVAIGPESEVDCSLYPDGSFEYCEFGSRKQLPSRAGRFDGLHRRLTVFSQDWTDSRKHPDFLDHGADNRLRDVLRRISHALGERRLP